MLVLLNFTAQNSSIEIPEIKNIDYQVDKITLKTYQAVIYSLKN